MDHTAIIMFIKKFKIHNNSIKKLNYWFLLIPCLLIGFLSSIRWPSAWTATHALFDYSDGFAREAFMEIFYLFFMTRKFLIFKLH